MKAYRMHGLGDSHLDEGVATPIPGVGEVLVAPEAAGICGTDLHVLHEGVYIDLEKGLPVTMGHEVVGHVVELGTEPAGGWISAYGGEPFAVGDRVVAEPLINCGSCPQCLRGKPNLCRQWSHLGFLRDGVWAETVSIPAARLTRISEDVPREQAVLAEPLACALHFLERAHLKPGDSVAVIGGGPAGQLTLLAARAAGAGVIALSDPVEPRRELALALGAAAVLNPTMDDISARLRAMTGGRGPDIVIEIAGTPQAVTQAIALPRMGGTVVLAGISDAHAVPLDTNRAVVDEIDIRGAHATRWQMDAAVRILERASIDVSPIVSLQRPWTEADKGMRDIAERPEVCKVVLTF
jgi:threonine dehydrogenase-like Zn-dependent dehydrogenase